MTGIVVAVASFVAAHLRSRCFRVSLLVAGAFGSDGRGWGSRPILASNSWGG